MQSITFSDARKHFAATMNHVTNDAEPVRIMRRDAPDIG
ncbi:type II toxin-antitoxin system Phd/YefM family antitoxin [Aeromonas caviae]|uniref:Antitoxin n=1 Tax=Aeromonas caviae TaxID=648 RepID=A0A7T3X0M7_AERCA|nr:type II toxin-antitoxin system Phd/YefM family antitoxin [Aeromonas caviae]